MNKMILCLVLSLLLLSPGCLSPAEQYAQRDVPELKSYETQLEQGQLRIKLLFDRSVGKMRVNWKTEHPMIDPLTEGNSDAEIECVTSWEYNVSLKIPEQDPEDESSVLYIHVQWVSCTTGYPGGVRFKLIEGKVKRFAL